MRLLAEWLRLELVAAHPFAGPYQQVGEDGVVFDYFKGKTAQFVFRRLLACRADWFRSDCELRQAGRDIEADFG